MRNYTLAAASLLLVVGCGKDPSTGGDDTTGTPDADSTYQPDPGYVKLLSRTWSLDAGATNIYKCLRYTVPTDTYITSIEAQAPLGTHHTVLSVVSNNVAGPDGEYDCGVQTLGNQMLYASGVGTSPLDFPTDVGLKIPAGTQIHLNLHLYNSGDEPLTGESGIYVKTTPTPPPMLAEMVFSGNVQFTIPAPNPPGSAPQPYNVSGSCTIPASMKLFELWPHMHKIATHQKIELIHGGTTPTTTTLLDKDYSFGEQVYWPQSPMIDVVQGDKVKVTCTYLNTTGQAVSFGDGSDKEMCFGGMYRYPAQGSSLFCVF